VNIGFFLIFGKYFFFFFFLNLYQYKERNVLILFVVMFILLKSCKKYVDY
jgi:hypothetical protein